MIDLDELLHDLETVLADHKRLDAMFDVALMENGLGPSYAESKRISPNNPFRVISTYVAHDGKVTHGSSIAPDWTREPHHVMPLLERLAMGVRVLLTYDPSGFDPAEPNRTYRVKVELRDPYHYTLTCMAQTMGHALCAAVIDTLIYIRGGHGRD